MKNISILLLFLLLGQGIMSCSNMNDPYYNNSGRYYDDGRYNPRYTSGRDRYYNERERDRIENERRDLAIERDRLERERERLERQKDREARRPAPQAPETCPSGWRPGSCSKKDRKHGCKDKRMPRGLGCRTN